MKSEISRDRACRAAGREADRRQRPIAVRSYEGRRAGHVGAIAASKDHGIGRGVSNALHQLVEVDRIVTLKRKSRAAPERIEEGPRLLELPRAAIDDDDGAHAFPSRTAENEIRPTTMRRALALLVMASTFGCGTAGLRAAQQGDHSRLKVQIADEHRRGALSNDAAASLARAVASHAIASARTDADATARLSDLRACTREVDDALRDRMARHDGPGAEAAMDLVDAELLGEARARDFLFDGDDRWRAVGTRMLHDDDDGPARRKAMVDPSPRVRRSAMRAAADAQDVADLDVLYESARLDPELLLRNEAIRAMSAIVRQNESAASNLTTRLRDLWATGDDAVREEIADVAVDVTKPGE